MNDDATGREAGPSRSPANGAAAMAARFLVVGLLVSTVENALLVRTYDLVHPGPGRGLLFVTFFATLQAVAWAVAGAGVGAGLARWPGRRATPRTRRALGLALLALLAAGYVLLAAVALDPALRREPGRLLLAILPLSAAAGLVAAGVGALPWTAVLRSRRAVMLAAGCVAAAAVVAWGGGLAAAPASPGERAEVPGARRVPGARLDPGTNVLLIVLDTLRADHLSALGYARATSPVTAALAAEGVNFTQAIGQATRTSPNTASLLTGVTAFSHGIVSSRMILDDDLLTWGEILSAAGYRNIAFVANPNVGNRFQFTQGFDEVTELFLEDENADAADVYGQAIRRLEEGVGQPFFMWLHPIDPHTPYDPPAPYDTLFYGDPVHAEKADIRLPYTEEATDGGLRPSARVGDITAWGDYIARYDGEIRYADSQLAILLQKLDELGLRDDTLVIFTSDHGESLGEHDYFFAHGTYAYEATAHVPLILSHPALPRGQVIDDLVRTIDVLPSVLGLLGLPVPSVIEGRSFLPLLEDPPSPEPGRVAAVCAGSNEYVTVAARDDRHKLILAPRPMGAVDALLTLKLALWPGGGDVSRFRARAYTVELYDLQADPEETDNLAGRGLPQEAALRGRILEWFDGARRASEAVRLRLDDLDEKTRERLRSLGYVQ